MIKYFFCDFDGVLNSVDNSKVLGNLWHLDNNLKSKDEYGKLFDERCVRWLDYIIRKTDCKIVISSTWRRSGLSAMKEMWKHRNLPGEIIDITPTYLEPWIYGQFGHENQIRGAEIHQWLSENKYDTYCIVDDNNDMLPHQNFVQTNPDIGLNFETSMKIIKILNDI